MPVNPVSGASVYVDPSTLRCAYCDSKMAFSKIDRERYSRTAQSPQVWCTNPKCPAKDVVGDVCIDTFPGSVHRMRPVAVAVPERED